MILIKNLKIISFGTSRGIIIPAHFFEHGGIDENVVYDVVFENSKKKEE